MTWHKFSDKEIQKYRAMDEHVKINILEYLWKKQQEHIKKGYTKESFCITDAEFIEDFKKYGPKYGLWIAEKLLAIGYLEIDNTAVPQLQVSFRGKVRQFFSKLVSKTTENSGR